MNILNLLDVLEDELEKGVTVPFAGKCLIDREKCLEIIKDIRLNLPDEIKQAEWVKKERQRIIIDAQKESETMVKETEQRIKSLVDENEITQKAYQQAREIIETAQSNAKEIRLGAKEYADELLEQVEACLKNHLSVLANNRQELKSTKR